MFMLSLLVLGSVCLSVCLSIFCLVVCVCVKVRSCLLCLSVLSLLEGVRACLSGCLVSRSISVCGGEELYVVYVCDSLLSDYHTQSLIFTGF